ncbi:MAG TPA: RodZ domain-containing protein [Sphingomonadaceae bacterium]|nr:RodZ domain-containing protein [Sphingomonadaceae bacterium]
MVDEESEDEFEVAPPGVGESLRTAREAKGLSLAEIAARTRITERHLALIEAGQFDKLPGRTYAVGFSRSYAKLVDLDQGEIARRVREELAILDPQGSGFANRAFEPGDPARIPSSGLAWFSAFAALVLLVGGSLFVWSTYVSPGASLPWLTADETPREPGERAESTRPAMPQVAEIDPSGEVVFTASARTWVRFYEDGGQILLERELAAGESFAIPPGAIAPKLVTAQPDMLDITIGGVAVPRLAESGELVDLPVSAAALLARGAPADEAPPAGTAPAPAAVRRAPSTPVGSDQAQPAANDPVQAAPAAPPAAADADGEPSPTA